MPIVKEINNYELWFASYDNFNEWKANIILRRNDVIVVDLRLVDNPATWASHQQVQQNGISQIYGHINQLPIYLDILRNEKPLYVTLYENVSGPFAKCLLGTSREPIGEGEMSSRGLMPSPRFLKKRKRSK